MPSRPKLPPGHRVGHRLRYGHGREPNDSGDRVTLQMSGKFLLHKHDGNEDGVAEYGVTES